MKTSLLLKANMAVIFIDNFSSCFWFQPVKPFVLFVLPVLWQESVSVESNLHLNYI